ncbi:MAG: transcriptional repressor [Firmicutes bacterium]|nr:transcriptional repressor [Bacillota bacterium]
MRADDIAARLRARGFRLTAPRWAVIRYLEGNDRHPTAQEIFEALHPQYPGLSLTTVYNTLSTLEAIGALTALANGPDGQRYDPNVEPHANLICRGCGRVVDVPADGLADLLRDVAARAGFELPACVADVHGLCADCRAKEAAS